MGLFDFKPKTLSAFGITLFMVVGTYNAVVINSESSISSADMRFVKRLDELYGVTEYARGAASATQWQKLPPATVSPAKKIAQKKVSRALPKAQKQQDSKDPGKENPSAVAAVQETLDLNLVEVINTKKWASGLKQDQFNGSLATNNGVIESLNVALPGGAGVSVSFSEMNGNVFEYDLEGELYSGMMYQVDTNSYMVTLTNGPLEGTRLRFQGTMSVEQEQANEQAVADAQQNDNQNYGNDGRDTAQPEEVASAGAPATNSQEAYDRDLMIQQQAQAASEQASLNTLQAQEAPADQEAGTGYYEQLQQQLQQDQQAQAEYPQDQQQG